MRATLKKSVVIIFTIAGIVITLYGLNKLKNSSQTQVYSTYDSLKEFTETNSNSESIYEIIAQEDKYAVCLVTGVNYTELKILSKTEDEKWKDTSEDSNCKQNVYINMSMNTDFQSIFNYKIKDNNDDIIIVQKAPINLNYNENFYNEDDKKLRKIGDSQNTKFYYITKYSKDFLDIYYIGFVDNFDEDTYILNINDKEYPYKELKKLLRR